MGRPAGAAFGKAIGWVLISVFGSVGALARPAPQAAAKPEPLASGGEPHLRADAAPALGSAVCTGALGDTPQAAWANRLYDAQLQGVRIERLGQVPVSAEQAERRARALARTRRYRGYAFGICPDGHGWALALPSSVGLAASEGQGGRLVLPEAELTSSCASWRVDFAARDRGQPRQLTVSRGTVATAALGDGTLSVTCQPRAPRWQGPVLWFLYPVGQGPLERAPEGQGLSSQAAEVAPLGPWVNRLRQREGLPAVEVTRELSEQATILAADGGLTHDRLLLQKARDTLGAQETKLLGEDRVRSTSLESMGWLLWHSPRHRALLLHAEARVMGLGSRKQGAETLVVLLMGQKEPRATARQERGPGPAAAKAQ